MASSLSASSHGRWTASEWAKRIVKRPSPFFPHKAAVSRHGHKKERASKDSPFNSRVDKGWNTLRYKEKMVTARKKKEKKRWSFYGIAGLFISAYSIGIRMRLWEHQLMPEQRWRKLHLRHHIHIQSPRPSCLPLCRGESCTITSDRVITNSSKS